MNISFYLTFSRYLQVFFPHWEYHVLQGNLGFQLKCKTHSAPAGRIVSTEI